MARLFQLNEGGPATVLERLEFSNEKKLHRLLEENPELIAIDEADGAPAALLPIGSEFVLAGLFLDLLFVDTAGTLVVVETKLRSNPEIHRDVVGQILEYASHLSRWTVDDVERRAKRYLPAPSTPKRFRAASLYEALLRLCDEHEDPSTEEDLRKRITASLEAGRLRLIIAVDEVAERLRSTVAFLSSRLFDLYLLEVQEHKFDTPENIERASRTGGTGEVPREDAPEAPTIASINLYGTSSGAHARERSARPVLDEDSFLEELESRAPPADVRVARDLLDFIKAEGALHLLEESVGFRVGHGREKFNVFGLTTTGVVFSSMGNFRRRLERKAQAQFLATLRSFGADAPESYVGQDIQVRFQASLLAEEADRERFRTAVREVQMISSQEAATKSE